MAESITNMAESVINMAESITNIAESIINMAESIMIWQKVKGAQNGQFSFRIFSSRFP